MEKQLDIFDQKPEPTRDYPENIISLKEARDFVNKGSLTKDGCYCPCCGRKVKTYKRPINSTMTRLLINLYFITLDKGLPGQNCYFHVGEIARGIVLTGTADFHKLKYWDLIYEKPKDPENTKVLTSGYWMISPKGIDFVRNHATVIKFVLLDRNILLGYEGPQVSIIDCLSSHFNYEDLMDQIINIPT